MHCVYSADLAALISHHGPAMIKRQPEIPSHALTDYWSTSRSRFELWHQLLGRYREYEKSGNSDRLKRWWKEHSVVLEEVLVTEMLTRVVAAIACGLESESTSKEVSPVTQAVQTSHLEVRNRVQQVMLFGRGNSVHDVVRLNRLRQGVERWTDAMVGRMSSEHPAMMQYAIDPNRAAEYADEMRAYGEGAAKNTAAWLMNAAMHDVIRRRTSNLAALPKSNRQVAQSVMKLLRPELFDDTGVMKSLWLQRFELGNELTDQFMKTEQPHEKSEALPVGENAVQGERWYI
ncbi:MAG: hypothetical protein AAGG48_28480 [Planctomycetota bacterium]